MKRVTKGCSLQIRIAAARTYIFVCKTLIKINLLYYTMNMPKFDGTIKLT